MATEKRSCDFYSRSGLLTTHCEYFLFFEMRGQIFTRLLRMRTLSAVKDDISGVSGPTLRSGLYIVRSTDTVTADEQLYVLYWPQDTTWDDSALSSV